jgi:hypothetical protein
VIEIDDPTHYGRRCADRSRDRLLDDAGIALVDRIRVEEAADRRETDALVARHLRRLVA